MRETGDLFRLLGDEARLRLLRILAGRHGRLNVTELTAVLGLAQSGVSRHLKLLKDAGLVIEERGGGFAFYRLSPALLDGGFEGLWTLLQAQFAAAGASAAARADDARLQEVHPAPQGELRLARHRPRPARAWAQLGRLVARAGTAPARRGRGRPRRAAKGISRSRPQPGPAASSPSTARPMCSGGRARSPIAGACRTSSGSAATRKAAARRAPRWTSRCSRRRCTTRSTRAGRLRKPSRILRPGGRVIILDLREHDQEWVRDRLGDRWLGFRDDDLQRLLRRPDCATSRCGVGARLAGDPFTVLVAGGVKRACDPAPVLRHDRASWRRLPDVATTRHASTPCCSAHPGARRRHGHDDPAPPADRGRFPRRAVRLARQAICSGNNDVLVLTRPDIIADIHDQYLAAGADIIETNTFNGTAIAQADYGAGVARLRAERSTARGWRAARRDEWTARTPDKPRFVAGVIGPTNRTLSISPDVNDPAFRAMTFDEMQDALRRAGARPHRRRRGPAARRDDLRHAERQGGARRDRGGSIRDGGRCRSCSRSRSPTGAAGRCRARRSTRSGSRSRTRGRWRRHQLRARRPRDAAVPGRAVARRDDLRQLLSERGPAERVRRVRRAAARHRPSCVRDFAASGFVNIVGGCCGTTPDHIRAIAQAVDGPAAARRSDAGRAARRSRRRHAVRRPRDADDPARQQLPDDRRAHQRHRFEALRTSSSSDGRFADAVDVALDQVRGGANLIDVNMDEGLLDSEQAMTHFLNLIATEPEIARLPIMIDSSKWSVLEAGLKCVQGKPVVNSISLKEGEEDFLRKARRVQRYGAGVVVMAFDEQRAGRHHCAQGRDLPARVPPADRASSTSTRTTSSSIRTSWRLPPASRSTTSTPINFIEAVRQIKAALPGRELQRRHQQPLVLVPRQRRRARGDPLRVPVPRHQGRPRHGHRQCRASWRCTRTCPRTCSSASKTSCSTGGPTRPSAWWNSPSASGDRGTRREADLAWRSGSLEARLSHALVHGVLDFLEADLEEARAKYAAAARRSSRGRSWTA